MLMQVVQQAAENMARKTARKPISEWFGKQIPAGESRNVTLAFGEDYSSSSVRIPIQVRRAKEDGPVVFVTGALHGDEINGTGAVRQLIQDPELTLLRGSVVLVPVLNMLAFERHSRYLPDRRDLNRSFPGSARGSLASRMARVIMDELVSRCDYGIDLHTASVNRSNYPNVRADMANPQVRKIARAFGSELILDVRGGAGTLRRQACRTGCPTILMEGGEVFKVEPGVVESATRGVKNILRHLGMLGGEAVSPDYQIVIEKSRWIRADLGGFLQFHISPGDIVNKGQPLATNTTLLGKERNILVAPFDAVVLGMTSLPAITPGEPICNLGRLPAGCSPEDLQRQRKRENGLEQRLNEDLSSGIMVVDAPE